MPSTLETLQQMSLAIAYMVQNQADFSDEQALAVSAIYPEWHIGVDYRAKQICRYNGEIYRCAQAHTSSDQNNPTVASLWTKITIDHDTGYDVWQQPSGSHDAYNVGDRVLYPDENGQVYESLINGNTWSPEAYPSGWKLIEEVATLSVDPYADWEITEEGLAAHTIAELQAYMEANGIDDTGCSVKADYIARIIENS